MACKTPGGIINLHQLLARVKSVSCLRHQFIFLSYRNGSAAFVPIDVMSGEAVFEKYSCGTCHKTYHRISSVPIIPFLYLSDDNVNDSHSPCTFR